MSTTSAFSRGQPPREITRHLAPLTVAHVPPQFDLAAVGAQCQPRAFAHHLRPVAVQLEAPHFRACANFYRHAVPLYRNALENARVPVDESVAAIFCPINPAFPMPVTIALPSAAAGKRPPQAPAVTELATFAAPAGGWSSQVGR